MMSEDRHPELNGVTGVPPEREECDAEALSPAPRQAEGEEESSHRSGFIALVGPANAGKSTLLNQLLGQKVSIVSPKPQTTRNRILGVKNLPEAQLVFFDTPGFFRERTPTMRFSQIVRGELGRYLSQAVRDGVSEVDVTLLVLDAKELLRRSEELSRLSQAFRNEGVRLPHLIALNKVDLVQKEALLPLLTELFTEFSEALGSEVEIIPLSARRGEGVEHLEQAIIKRLPVGPRLYPEDFLTDRSERFLAAEIVREKLFLQLGQEVPYSTAVQVEKWEEGEKLLKIGAVIFVERTSQRGIVIGKGGERLKSIGKAAREELERIFEKQVYLELFVRVEENWTRTERGLRRVGYE